MQNDNNHYGLTHRGNEGNVTDKVIIFAHIILLNSGSDEIV